MEKDEGVCGFHWFAVNGEAKQRGLDWIARRDAARDEFEAVAQSAVGTVCALSLAS